MDKLLNDPNCQSHSGGSRAKCITQIIKMSGNLTSVSDSLGDVPNENVVTTGDGDQLIDGLLGLLE